MTELHLFLLSGFLVALAAPAIVRLTRSFAGWVLALLPAGLFAYLIAQLPAVADGAVVRESVGWIPALGLNFSVRLDGLSLLFALIITGIGALVLVYSGGYMGRGTHIGRFYGYLLAFMGSMLGIVLADNLLSLFVFWELTSVTSFLLIGFRHADQEARSAALQALLVTSGGGLMMLVGFVILGISGGSYELSVLMDQSDAIRESPLYPAMALLVLAGAFTKSAQFPFHFWLPNAMTAPTPVSAYLHAATMVKAGIYLVARMTPMLGDTPLWNAGVTSVGAVTVVVASYLALRQTDFKRILAYSTVGALAIMMMLLGIGSELAIEAALLFLVAHALYKGTLFLVAGAVDHSTGVRDIMALGGLRRAMPVTALFAALAALSMAGIPLLLGFLGKEALYEAALGSEPAAALITAVAFFGALIFVAVALFVGYRPFFGAGGSIAEAAHEAPFSMLIGPGILGLGGLVFGIAPWLLGDALLSPAASAVAAASVEVHLATWPGLSATLLLSAVTIVAGVGLFLAGDRLRLYLARVTGAWGPERWYQLGFEGIDRLALWVTQLLQNGYLRRYLMTIVVVTIGLVGATLFLRVPVAWPTEFPNAVFYEWVPPLVILLGVGAVLRANTRLAAVAALGVVGFGVSSVYIIYGAPDLAMTQFLVEALGVVLFVLVLYHLRSFGEQSGRLARVRDALIATAAGVLMTVLVLVATTVQLQPPISGFFADRSVSEGQGHNVVNVILVDFRVSTRSARSRF